MKELLIGLIEFFGGIIEVASNHKNSKKAIVIAFTICSISFIILYFLTKQYS